MSTANLEQPDRVRNGIIEGGVRMGMGGCLPFEVAEDLPTAIPEDSPIIQGIGETFDLGGFERPRAPFSIGKADLTEIPTGTVFFGLPLKFPGTEYRVPEELACVSQLLGTCASYESVVNPNLNDYYAYLSLYRTWVEKGERQLTAGIHSDGIQGRRIEPKVPTEHGYQVTDSHPTNFFPQSFNMTGVDVAKHLMDAVFESQVDRQKAVSIAAGQIAMFDAYCVHQAVPTTQSGWRTFAKLMYTPRQYDRLGNAVNVLFTAEYANFGWEFGPRPIPSDLEMPPLAA